MTQLIVDASSGSGYLESFNATYATAATGSNLSVDTYGTATYIVGQSLAIGVHYIYQTFVAFDTSAIPDNVIIDSVILRVAGASTDLDTTAFTYEARPYAFGTLATADWRTAAQLGALTLVASVASSAWSTGTFDLTNVDFPANINKTGLTEVVIAASRFRTASVPTGDEYQELDSDSAVSPAIHPQIIVDYHVPSSVTRSVRTLRDSA